ncbi:MAG: FxsA family protein [Flavobacteriaceae bacterium]
MAILLLAFVGVPLIEIALFIEIGGRIGLAATIGVVIATAILGSIMLRLQGLSALGSINRSLERGEFPAEGLRDGALLLFAAALLLTPGFFTDAIGFALLFPPVRRAVGAFIFRYAAGRVEVRRYGPSGDRSAGPRPRGPVVIEGEAREIDDDERRGGTDRRR